jgi:ribonucleoside-diphosphate reductase alpha chain
VLNATHWPLPRQAAEAAAKRRIGLGFLGLGDALVMLGLRYDGEPARRLAARIAGRLRDAAYRASIALAGERGPFPLLDKERYLAGAFCRRLPPAIRAGIARTGIRNSHLLSIAPTGTISLAFADNASNGIEPPFAWTCSRRKRTAAGREDTYEVEDHAYRLYREAGHDTGVLPEGFVTALELAPLDHMRMLAAVQPYIDAAIAKTVNVSEDTPYDAFEGLYAGAWQAGLKGLTTYRPSAVRGAVLMPPVAPGDGAANICCGSRTTNSG